VTPLRLVVSGIDGGLFDPLTRDHDPVRPAVAALARLGIPLVLCSTRARAEVALVWRMLGLDAPIIVENGAALLVPDGHLRRGVPGAEWDGEWHVVRLGPPRETIRRALDEAAAAAGVRPRLCSRMGATDRVSPPVRPALFGPLADAREHTEPFLLGGEAEAEALAREARARGLALVRGQGFWHLCGGADKGLAVRTLLALYQREGEAPRSIGLGSWPIDLPMLRSVHRPILLPTRGGEIEPALAEALPGAERAGQGGPRGWSDAVFSAIGGHRLPPGARAPRRETVERGATRRAS
jgi:mannosyl-3-phosphoglycerate phosphatase